MSSLESSGAVQLTEYATVKSDEMTRAGDALGRTASPRFSGARATRNTFSWGKTVSTMA